MRGCNYIGKLVALLSLLVCFYNPSYAKMHSKSGAKLLISNDGRILYEQNADHLMFPASLAKLMTLYLTFENLKAKKISFDTSLTVSRKAAAMPRSNIDLKEGNQISVKQAILSLIVRSANDSAVAIAEHLAGTEKAFAERMTKRAHQLGMSKTKFLNASGWHHSEQQTTAYDMAKLAIALKRDFPEYYHLFSHTSFFYKNTFFKSHNHVLTNLDGAKGMKTGFTSKAGWNIVTAAEREGRSLIGVILGGKSHKTRDSEMIKMMNTYFSKKTMYTALDKKRISKIRKIGKDLQVRNPA